jgi:hypothetical protein
VQHNSQLSHSQTTCNIHTDICPLHTKQHAAATHLSTLYPSLPSSCSCASAPQVQLSTPPGPNVNPSSSVHLCQTFSTTTASKNARNAAPHLSTAGMFLLSSCSCAQHWPIQQLPQPKPNNTLQLPTFPLRLGVCCRAVAAPQLCKHRSELNPGLTVTPSSSVHPCHTFNQPQKT